MRRSLPLLVLLLAGTASCGRGGPDPRNRDALRETGGNAASTEAMAPAAPPQASLSADGDQRRAAGGPHISPTAAPGVAFNYNYSFALAA